MSVTPPDTTDVDVIIIGAGFSGLGRGPPHHRAQPGTSYVILERREQIGGTWDLFRYPGVRSDSSIFTLCFPWEPWTGEERVADGVHIREYLNATARKYGIDQHIRFDSHVRSADWDSSTDTWTVTAEQNGSTRPTAAASCSSAAATTTTTRATPRLPWPRTSSTAPWCTRSTGPRISTTPARRWW